MCEPRAEILSAAKDPGTKRCVAAGPVSRILSAGLLPQDGHSSRPGITARLKRPTRRFNAPSQHVSRRRSERFRRMRAKRASNAPATRAIARHAQILRSANPSHPLGISAAGYARKPPQLRSG